VTPRPLLLALLAAAALAPAALPQERPRYPEGAAIPRSLTAAERAWLAQNPLRPLAVTPPPSGPVHCAAEYEPMEAILLAWEGPLEWNAIQTRMAVEITRFGAAEVHVMVDSAAEQSAVQATLAAAGADMARVRFLVVATDTIWIRDYGPRYVFEGGCRAIVDHTYNRPRPNDDVQPRAFAQWKHHALYEHELVHGGGNYHLDALGRGYATRLINAENPRLTEQQIHGVWRAYLDVDTTFVDPFPTSVDYTQHIDMWMQVFADDAVMISDWPNDAGSVQDRICDAAAAFLVGRGYAVHRVPAFTVGGVHYTFTNVVLCNDLVLVPTYSEPSVAPFNAQAAAAWVAALPGKRVARIDAQAIVTAAGVLHCIVMHLPRPRGGERPCVYLKAPNGGEVLVPGATVEVRWISDDDVGVRDVDIWLSRNAGATFDEPIALATADDGSFTWTVPDVLNNQARLRVVARDGAGRTGSDDSDRSFWIAGGQCKADNVAYGQGRAGGGGAAPVLQSGTLAAIPSIWVADLSGARANAIAVLLFGLEPAAQPLAGGGTLLLVPAGFVAVATSARGTASLPVPIPPAPELCGLNTYWQAVVDDGALSAGLNARLGS
jgi:agmatine/peptidylarginine deiminase